MPSTEGVSESMPVTVYVCIQTYVFMYVVVRVCVFLGFWFVHLLVYIHICICIEMCAYVHSFVGRALSHSCISKQRSINTRHTCVHTYILTYKNTYTLLDPLDATAERDTYIHTHIHNTYIHTHIFIYLHLCLYTYTHMYIYIYMFVYAVLSTCVHE